MAKNLEGDRKRYALEGVRELEAGNLTVSVRAEDVDKESREVDIIASTENPVERWFGQEILSHKSGAVRLGRFNDSAPLLREHNSADQIGVVIPGTARLEGGKLKARVRFSENARGEEEFRDVVNGIRSKVSIGYRVHGIELVEKDGDAEVYRSDDWEPYEVSTVSIPADTGAKVGRNQDGKQGDNQSRTYAVEVKAREMKDEKNKAPDKEERNQDKPALEVIKPADPGITRAELDLELAAERERQAEIRAIAKRFKVEDLGEEHARAATTIDEFRKVVLEGMPKQEAAQPVQPGYQTGIRSDDKELKRAREEFSLNRFLHACVQGAQGGQPFDGFEREMAQEAEREAKTGGFNIEGRGIPSFLLSTRDQTVGAEGAEFVQTSVGNVIDALYERLMVSQLGAQTISGLQGNVSYPTITRGSAPTEKAENASADEYTYTTGSKTLSPNRLPVTSDVSKQLLIQSSPDAETITRNLLARELASRVDAMAINGSGSSNQPTGILNVSGIGDVAGGTNGATPDRADVVDLETEVATDNADVGTLAYLTTPGIRGELKQTQTDAGSGLFVWGSNEGGLNGYRAEVSTNVPSTLTKGSSSGICHALIFGNFGELVIGNWGGMDIVVDPYSKKTTGLVEITYTIFYDVLVLHAESFAAMQDALTS